MLSFLFFEQFSVFPNFASVCHRRRFCSQVTYVLWLNGAS